MTGFFPSLTIENILNSKTRMPPKPKKTAPKKSKPRARTPKRPRKKGAVPKKPKSRTIAITGVRGFLGSNLLKHLQEDGRHKIIALDLEKPDFLSPDTRFYKIDLTSTTADINISEILDREGCDTFVHLAFLSNPIHRTPFQHELQSVGTMYTLHACARRKIQKYILGSSTMVYGALATNPNFLLEDMPLQGSRSLHWVRDRIEAEEQVQAFQKKNPHVQVTVLRTCTILGPTARNFITKYLDMPVIMTLMGYDPLVQLVHEEDAVEAFRLAVERDCPGVFNIVGRGVLPLSTCVKLSGKIKLPVLHTIAYPLTESLWIAQVGIAPSGFLDYIRYLWVSDGARAQQELGYLPRYSTKETLETFLGIQRLRAIHLAE